MKIISLNKGLRALFYTLFSGVVFASLPAWAHASPSHSAYLQQSVNGIVSDASGPLPGVTVFLKGTANAVTTNDLGRYVIAASPSDVLVFSFIGYKEQEITVGKSITVNITLEEDATQLETLEINAGYYSVKQKESTGSISRVTSKDIEKQPVVNILGAMQGRMAGVDITQNSGLPGAGFEVQIRGINSLRSGGNAPLYIIDGVPFASDAIGSNYTSTTLPGPTSPLNSISPADIQSIEVLKDADATAIYGSRGANGVVLITTKKGRAGKTQFSALASTAVGQVTRKMGLMDTTQYLAMRRQAFSNDGITEYPSNAYDINGTWDQSRYTDWQEELTGKTATITNLQASVSGGSAQTHFLLSANGYKQSTVYPGNFDYKKGGVHAGFDHESKDQRFKLTFSGSYDVQKNDQPAADLTRISRNLAPNAPALYDAQGNLNWENSTWENPLASLNAKALSDVHTLIANSTLSYELPLGFIAKSSFGYTSVQNRETRIDPSTIYDPIYQAGPEYSAIFLSDVQRRSWIIEPQLQWQRELGKLRLTALVGGTFQNQQSDRLVQYASGFSSNSLINDLASASFIKTYANDQSVYRYQAFFGRVNIGWDNTYFLNLTGRRDGSSRFGPGRQFANFGAVGAAWLFSNLPLFEKQEILSMGKLRASYGVSGNDQIGDYQYLDTYVSSGNGYDSTIGLQPTRLFNPNFGWESNKKLEAALELGFLKDRIFLTLGYYRNRSSNQLVGVPLPSTTGFTSLQSNLGATVQNTGLEITLHTTNIQHKDFEWSSDLNFSIARNKLVSFPGLETSTYKNQYVIGESINIQKLYHYTGIDPQTGTYTFEDFNGDGSLSSADDAQTIRDFSPKFYGGFSNSLRYKGLQLDLLFQFVKQQNWGAASQYSPPGAFTNQPAAALGSWQQPGDSGPNQIYTSGLNSEAVNAYYRYAASDAAVSDASYIRLKNVSLSYNLPDTIGVQCRIFLQGQNLLTITPYKDGDPEFRNFNYLPPLRIVSLGTEIKF